MQLEQINNSSYMKGPQIPNNLQDSQTEDILVLRVVMKVKIQFLGVSSILSFLF